MLWKRKNYVSLVHLNSQNFRLRCCKRKFDGISEDLDGWRLILSYIVWFQRVVGNIEGCVKSTDWAVQGKYQGLDIGGFGLKNLATSHLVFRNSQNFRLRRWKRKEEYCIIENLHGLMEIWSDIGGVQCINSYNGISVTWYLGIWWD